MTAGSSPSFRRSPGGRRCSISATASRARARRRGRGRSPSSPRFRRARPGGGACAQLAALPPGRPVVIDGLAFGVLADAAAAQRSRHPLVSLVHHPLALESGLNAAEAAAFQQSERAALACARHVVVTSRATARLLAADYDVPAERLSVVEPGTDRNEVPPRTSGQVVALLAVGAVVPRKGYDVLVAALAQLKDIPWRLVIAG